MKDYLNQKERSDIIMLCALLGYIKEEMIGQWGDRKNLTTDEKRYLKTSATLLTKVYDSIKGRLDSKFSAQLARDARGTKIFCMPREKAEIQIASYKEDLKNEIAQVSLVALETLAEKALHWCKDCNEDHKTCIIKQTFINLNIPPYDCETKDCPYKINEGEEIHENKEI